MLFLFSLLASPKGGEGRGEEAKVFRDQIPSPQPSPRLGGERESVQGIPRNARRARVRGWIGRWKLHVKCSMFLSVVLLFLAAFPLRGQTNSEATNAPLTLSPPYGELPPTFFEQHGTILMLAGLGIIALAAFGLWLIFRPKPKTIIPPEVQARRALEALREQTGGWRSFESHLASVAKLFHGGVSTVSRRIDHDGILPRCSQPAKKLTRNNIRPHF